MEYNKYFVYFFNISFDGFGREKNKYVNLERANDFITQGFAIQSQSKELVCRSLGPRPTQPQVLFTLVSSVFVTTSRLLSVQPFQLLPSKICSQSWSDLRQKLQLPLTYICNLQFMYLPHPGSTAFSPSP